jgi:hypothetical protein
MNGILPKIEPSQINKKIIRKPYRKPILIELGDLRTRTLGSSNITEFESGGMNGKEYVYFY